MENAAEVHHQLQLLHGQAKFSSQWQSEGSPTQPKPQHNPVDVSLAQGRLRHDSDDDSPPRRPCPGHGSAAAPVAKQQRHDSDDDCPPGRAERSCEVVARPQQQPTSRQLDWENSQTQRNTKRSPGLARVQHNQASHVHRSEDESPPRRPTPKSVTAQSGSDDESPPRRRGRSENMAGYLERQSTGHRSVTEMSHERQSRKLSATKVNANINGEAMRRAPIRHDSDDESPERRRQDIGVSQRRSQNQSIA